MELIYYPNQLLESKCEPVTVFDTNLHALLDGMKATMLLHNGVGLSANQVGVLQQVMIVQATKGETYEMINPVLLEVDGQTVMSEGCLSSPTIFLPVMRSSAVVIQYQDRTGEVKKAMAQGTEARCVLHELDHLSGVFYFSKVNRQMRKEAISKLKKVLK